MDEVCSYILTLVIFRERERERSDYFVLTINLNNVIVVYHVTIKLNVKFIINYIKLLFYVCTMLSKYDIKLILKYYFI